MTNMNGAIIPPQIKRDKSPALRVSTSVCAASVTASNPGVREKSLREQTQRGTSGYCNGREVAIQLQSSCKAPATGPQEEPHG